MSIAVLLVMIGGGEQVLYALKKFETRIFTYSLPTFAKYFSYNASRFESNLFYSSSRVSMIVSASY